MKNTSQVITCDKCNNSIYSNNTIQSMGSYRVIISSNSEEGFNGEFDVCSNCSGLVDTFKANFSK